MTSNDRQALRDYYYQVKACTTWCMKMGQSAILQAPEFLSRATMQLPMNVTVRWYRQIGTYCSTLLKTSYVKSGTRVEQEAEVLSCIPLLRQQSSPPKFQETAVTYLTPNKPVSNSAVKRAGTKPNQMKRGVLFAASNTVLAFVLFSSPSPCKKGGKLHGKMNFALIS